MHACRSALTVFAVAVSLILPLRARAASFDIAAGRSTTTGNRWTTAVFADVSGATRDCRGIHWQPAATLGWIQDRDTRVDRLDHDVFIGGAGVKLVDWWGGAFFSAQFGLADGRTDAISSAGQFITTLGWQGRHFMVYGRHISNARLFGGRNLGETMLMVGVRF